MDEKEKMACAETAATESGAKRPYVKPQTEIIELEPANAVNTADDPGEYGGLGYDYYHYYWDVASSCAERGKRWYYNRWDGWHTHRDPRC